MKQQRITSSVNDPGLQALRKDLALRWKLGPSPAVSHAVIQRWYHCPFSQGETCINIGGGRKIFGGGKNEGNHTLQKITSG